MTGVSRLADRSRWNARYGVRCLVCLVWVGGCLGDVGSVGAQRGRRRAGATSRWRTCARERELVKLRHERPRRRRGYRRGYRAPLRFKGTAAVYSRACHRRLAGRRIAAYLYVYTSESPNDDDTADFTTATVGDAARAR